MESIVRHIIEWLLEELGIDRKQQFLWMVLILVAWFIVHMIRTRRQDVIISVLFILMALTFVVFLLTESANVRWGSAALIAGSIAGLFVRHALRNRPRRGT